MMTVPIQLANKKKTRNATKRHELSTLHTITHTLKTVDSVFGHTLILHDQTQRANKEHHNAHKSFDTAANAVA